MKVLNAEIFAAQEPLRKLLEMKFPVKTSFALVQLATKLGERFTEFETVRNGLVTTYGKQNNGQVTVSPEDEGWEKFTEEFNELLAQGVELVFDKVILPVEIDGKPLEIEPMTLIALTKFVGVE